MLASIQRGLRVQKQLARPLEGLGALPLIKDLQRRGRRTKGGDEGMRRSPEPLPRSGQSSNRRYTGVAPARDYIAKFVARNGPTCRPLWEARLWVRACEAVDGAPGGASIAWDPAEASLGSRGVNLHLGFFESPELAAEQFDRAALYFRGPSSHTNFESWSYLGDKELDQMVAMGRSACVAQFQRVYGQSLEGLGPGVAWETHQPGGSGEATATGTPNMESSVMSDRQLPPGTLEGLIRAKTLRNDTAEQGDGPSGISMPPDGHEDPSPRALPAPSVSVAASTADREKTALVAQGESPSLRRTALGEIQAVVQTLRARPSPLLGSQSGGPQATDVPAVVSNTSE
jgi:hypothetical protein